MMRRQGGMALAELLVAAVIAALLMAGLNGVLQGVQQTNEHLSGRALLQRDARLAMARVAVMVEGSQRLLVPLETTTGTRDVLAVALPAALDRDGNGFADADNDRNGTCVFRFSAVLWTLCCEGRSATGMARYSRRVDCLDVRLISAP